MIRLTAFPHPCPGGLLNFAGILTQRCALWPAMYGRMAVTRQNASRPLFGASPSIQNTWRITIWMKAPCVAVPQSAGRCWSTTTISTKCSGKLWEACASLSFSLSIFLYYSHFSHPTISMAHWPCWTQWPNSELKHKARTTRQSGKWKEREAKLRENTKKT